MITQTDNNSVFDGNNLYDITFFTWTDRVGVAEQSEFPKEFLRGIYNAEFDLVIRGKAGTEIEFVYDGDDTDGTILLINEYKKAGNVTYPKGLFEIHLIND